jgi:hypothetical protein
MVWWQLLAAARLSSSRFSVDLPATVAQSERMAVGLTTAHLVMIVQRGMG